jgi:hypothetical protein
VAIIDDLSEVCRSQNGCRYVEVAAFALSLFKPVKTSILFGLIAETPVYCFPYRNLDPSSAPVGSIPCLCPLQELRSVHREKGCGAGLLCDDNNNPNWTTRISLHGVEFSLALDGESDCERDADTLYELMKISGRARDGDIKGESTDNGVARYLIELTRSHRRLGHWSVPYPC